MPLEPEYLDDSDKPKIGVNWYHYKGLGAAGAEISSSEWSASDAGVELGSDATAARDDAARELNASVQVTALPAGAGSYSVTNKAVFSTGETYSMTVALVVTASL